MLNGQNGGISGDSSQALDYVWDWHKDGKEFFVKVPTCIIWSMMQGQLTFVETKMILFICRMIGFKGNNKKTRSLTPNDFVKYTRTAKSHISKSISNLLAKGWILRSRELGGGHKYSINLKSFGIDI